MTTPATFADLALAPALHAGLDALGYTTLTPIQAQSLPAILDRRDLIAQATPLLDAERVIALRRAVLAVHASEALVGYVQALVGRSRKHPGVRVGLSPRAGLALLRATGVGEALLLQHAQAQAPLRLVDRLLKHQGQGRVQPLAHCFCATP